MSAKGFKRAASVPSANDRPPPPPPEQDRRRLDPAEALAAAASVAPTLPPTQVEATAPVDPVAQLNLKIRASLIDQLAATAEREGTTQKVIVCRALAAAGFDIHPDDLADRSNHRRRRS